MHRATPPRHGSRHGPALLVAGLVAGLVAVLGLGGVAVLATRGEGHGSGPRLVAERSLVAPRQEARAAQLLRRWDQARADAWAGADREALVGLYVPGSAAGRRDVAMLAAWTRRGLRVQGLRTQVVRVRVLTHRPGRYELEVIDRVEAGTAVGPGVSRPLPRDSPSARRVVLVERGERWLVDTVSRSGAGDAVSAEPSSAPP